MASLSKVLIPEAKLAIPMGQEVINVTYRPNYLTGEFDARLQELNNSGEATKGFYMMFTEVVAAWDLKNEETDDYPISLTEQALKKLPLKLLGDILEKINEDNDPKAKKEPN